MNDKRQIERKCIMDKREKQVKGYDYRVFTGVTEQHCGINNYLLKRENCVQVQEWQGN